MKKTFTIAFGWIVCFCLGANGQTDLQNNGIFYIAGSADIVFVTGSFTNTAPAAFTNNGSFYLAQALTNAQAGMAAGTGTLILNGLAQQDVNGGQLFKTYNLVTNNTAGVKLNNDLSVSNLHTFTNGIITSAVAPGYLIYEAGASYTGDGDSRHVNGWVQKSGTTAFSFPLGNGTVERRIGISNLSVSSVVNANYAGLTTNTANIAAPLVTVDHNEFWWVNLVSGGTATINMNWDYSKTVIPPYALADIRVANYSTGNWRQAGGSASGNVATTGTISSATVSSFGAFTFGSISFALPLTLVDFSASRNNGHVVLHWTTSDEVNVDYFDLGKSTDGIAFHSIGTVPARNLSTLQYYSLTDLEPLQSASYYRLKSVDIDGKTKFSKIVFVVNNSSSRQISIVNPVRNTIRLKAQGLTGQYQYAIETLNGKTIQKGEIQLRSGEASEILLESPFATGIYMLRIRNTAFSVTERLVIQ